MLKKPTALLLICFTFAAFAGDKEITKEELYEHIKYLASDDMKGRKPGTPESRKAAKYIKNELPKGIKFDFGMDGYQFLDITIDIEAGDGNELVVDGTSYEFGTDFTPLSFTENATLESQIVFAGYGFDFDTDSLTWHDYENINVEGKWVMVLRGDPEMDNHNSPFIAYGALRQKVMKAKDKGAGGVLFVSGVEFDKKDDLLKLTYDKTQATSGVPVIHIKRHVADAILKSNGQTVDSLETILNESRKPNSFVTNSKAKTTTNVLKRRARTQNILGFLKGKDKTLRDEFIVLGAHYDHLGMGGPGSGSRAVDTLAVHNGADDNASGVATVLEVMEKLAKSDLKKSIIFVAFAAEEMGTLGSKYFTENSPVPIENIKFMFNVDMIGRFDPDSSNLSVAGTGTGDGLSDLVEKIADQNNIPIAQSPEGYGPSDHAPFYASNVPVLFFSGGAHKDYHTPDDDIEGINFDGVKLAADYVYDLVVNVANKEDNFVYQEAGPKSRPMGRRRFKVTLGIMPDYAGANNEGLQVDGVIPDRPAALAGMKKGDVINDMDGKAVTNIYDYMYRLNEFEPGQRISVTVKRGDKEVILIVDL
jgi:aminopeptidase YwaD